MYDYLHVQLIKLRKKRKFIATFLIPDITNITDKTCFLGFTYKGEIGTVTGWGHTAYKGNISLNLQVVKLPLLSMKECRELNSWWVGEGNIPDSVLCANHPNSNIGACHVSIKC